MWFVFNEIPANITASSDGIVIYKYYGKSPVEVEYLNLRDGDYSFLAAKDWLVKLLETTYWPFQKLKANLLFSGRIKNLFAQDISFTKEGTLDESIFKFFDILQMIPWIRVETELPFMYYEFSICSPASSFYFYFHNLLENFFNRNCLPPNN